MLPDNVLKDIINCKSCKLKDFRKYVVPGKGDIPADILFLGEAPGRSENVIGLPFEGVSGKFLHRMIRQAARLTQRNINKIIPIPSYYITNIILCRPCDSLQSGNRKPLSYEVLACKSNLSSIISLVNPKIVVFIGKEALKYYKNEFSNFVTITHPSALLRTGGQGSVFYNQNIIILSNVFEKIIKETYV